MAAAALGNTISDLLGIGSAWYVESFADKLGEYKCTESMVIQIHYNNSVDPIIHHYY